MNYEICPLFDSLKASFKEAFNQVWPETRKWGGRLVSNLKNLMLTYPNASFVASNAGFYYLAEKTKTCGTKAIHLLSCKKLSLINSYHAWNFTVIVGGNAALIYLLSPPIQLAVGLPALIITFHFVMVRMAYNKVSMKLKKELWKNFMEWNKEKKEELAARLNWSKDILSMSEKEFLKLNHQEICQFGIERKGVELRLKLWAKIEGMPVAKKEKLKIRTHALVNMHGLYFIPYASLVRLERFMDKMV